MTPFFLKCFDRLIDHEAGFQNDPNDRGNWTTGIIGKGECKGTKYGISAASYPHLDIKNLTLMEAKEIYYNDFWIPVRGDSFENSLVFQMFDSAVNHGIKGTKKIFQRAIGVKDDGIFGGITYGKAKSFSNHDLLKLFLAERLVYMTDASKWDNFGKGWARRIATNLKLAAIDTPD